MLVLHLKKFLFELLYILLSLKKSIGVVLQQGLLLLGFHAYGLNLVPVHYFSHNPVHLL